MNKILTKKITRNGQSYAVSLQVDKFDGEDAAPLETPHKNDRKFNIRLKQADVDLLNALSEEKDIPRSVLLNNLLHNILRDALLNIPERDIRLLVAQTADARARYDKLDWPWVLDVIGPECDALIENIEKYNAPVLQFQYQSGISEGWRSDSYDVFKNRLKGLGND